MKVLVHFDSQAVVPYGVWWLDEDGTNPHCYYPAGDGDPASVRGKLLVFGKSNPEQSWDDWFDYLTGRPPYFEDWVTYDDMGMSPAQLLAALAPPPPLPA